MKRILILTLYCFISGLALPVFGDEQIIKFSGTDLEGKAYVLSYHLSEQHFNYWELLDVSTNIIGTLLTPPNLLFNEQRFVGARFYSQVEARFIGLILENIQYIQLQHQCITPSGG